MASPPSPPPPTRCTAAEIASVLAATAQPQSRMLLSQPLEPVAGPVTITTDQLWRIRLWRLSSGELSYTMAASSPDGRTWNHGCQRQWETTGEVIEPLELLSQPDTVALRARLECATSLPDLYDDPSLVVAPELDRVQPKRRPMRGNAR